MLSRQTIEKLSKTENLIVPFDPELLQPGTYDMNLDNEIIIKQQDPLKPKQIRNIKLDLNEDIVELQPNGLALASTVETVNIPNYLQGKVEGKSSIGRLGLFIVITAGVLDAGFKGQITLELYNASPVPIRLNDFNHKPFCQVAFHELDEPVVESYNGHYQNQKKVTDSWIKTNNNDSN